jgi:acetylornithine deacetylase/succinyl-diaminopimelate desuccinylase-like protein
VLAATAFDAAGRRPYGPAMSVEAFTGPTTELLQTLIRNECVNDGRPESGEERRNADVLQTYLEGAGLDVEPFESRPGRASIVARIEGRDPNAPALCLMGHTDVVPVNPAGWSHDPFGAELIDGEVWGRGALDMLNITSSMAVAFRQLATDGFRPEGTLIYFGVADEEAGGRWGAEYMVDNHWDAVGAPYVLTESGGWSQTRGDGTQSITVNVAEKGLSWRRMRVAGTPGHGSMPYGADNALITAAEIVRRLAAYRTVPNLDDLWTARLDSMDLSDEVRVALSDPATLDNAIASLPPAHARVVHACSHTTISPNVIHGGQKTNTIPDVIDIDVDMRTVPGDTKEVVDRYLAEALGDLATRVETSPLQEADATRSPIDNPLWDAVTACTKAVYPEARIVPGLITGGTDARFYRLKGSVAYGAALFSAGVTMEEFSARFHGNNERIDTQSLGLSADFWYRIAHQLLG